MSGYLGNRPAVRPFTIYHSPFTAVVIPWLMDLFDEQRANQSAQAHNIHFTSVEFPFEVAFHIVRHDKILSARILSPEGEDAVGLEARGGPSAFDRGRRRPAPRHDEVHLVLTLVPPILYSPRLQ